MLDLLRRKAQSPYIQATVLVIIVVFLFWIPNSGNDGSGQTVVASVNDQAISYADYQQAYDQTVERYRKQFGGNLPANLLETLGIKEQVINGLIQRTLIQQAAREMGMLASDEEVAKAIQEMETFKNNGVFDLGWYQQVLNSSRIGVTDFEAGMRSDLITNKVMDQVKKFSKVAEPELQERFAYDYGEKKFSYVEIDAEAFKKEVTVTEEGLKAYFDENKQNYKSDPQVKINYLLFPFGKDGSAVNIPESEIEKYYNEHIEEYQTPEKRRASHVLIKTAPDDTDEIKAEKKAKAEDILTRAKNGEDFAKLAKENSEDSTASNGGDLGFFPRGRMVKPFEDSVFSMSENEISLVQTRYGFHIIKLVKIEPGSTPPLDKVRSSIEAKLKKEQGQSIAFAMANDAYEKIILSGSLAKYAENGAANIIETDFFDRASPPAALKANPAILATVFSLKKGELSSLIEGQASYAIVYIADVKEPQIPELAAVRERVEKDYIVAEAKKLARQAADNLLAAIQEGASLQAQADTLNVDVKESPFISRTNRSVKELPANVLENAFDLNAANPYPEKSRESNGKFYVIAFKESKELAADEQEKKKEELENKLKQEADANLLNAWTAYLRSKADITINQQFL